MGWANRSFRWESLRLASLGFAAHVSLYRLLKGRLVGRNVLILTTTGRRTMRKRSTPVYYVSDGDDYVIIASNGGEDRYPGTCAAKPSDASRNDSQRKRPAMRIG